MRIRSYQAACATAAFIFAVAQSPLRADEPLHIPVIVAQSGAAAFIGQTVRREYEIAQQVINADGGVRGQHVQFDFEDDASNPQTVVQLMNHLIADKAPVLIGPVLTQQCNAVMPLVRQSGPVLYCLSPGLDAPPYGYLFAEGVDIRNTIRANVRYLRERGVTRLGMLSSTDASGELADRDYAAALALPENRALTVVAREYFNTADLNVGAQLARIKAAAPQALLTWTVGPAFGTELHGVADAGLNVPVFTTNGNMQAAQLAQYAAFMPKELIFGSVLPLAHDSLAPGPVKSAQDRYFAAFRHAGVVPDGTSATSWDVPMIIADAYRHLGAKATADQFRSYINTLHGFAGILGIYDFRDGLQHGLGVNDVVVMRYDGPNRPFVRVSARGGGRR